LLHGARNPRALGETFENVRAASNNLLCVGVPDSYQPSIEKVSLALLASSDVVEKTVEAIAHQNVWVAGLPWTVATHADIAKLRFVTLAKPN
jgi:hypothetical protein